MRQTSWGRHAAAILLGLGLCAIPNAATAKGKPERAATGDSVAAAQSTKPPQNIDESPPPASGDEAFGDEGAVPGAYTIRTLFQTRYTRTVPDFGDEFEARLHATYPDAASYAVASGAIRNNARDNDGIQLQRIFLRATATPTRAFSVKLLVDFAELVHKNQKRALKLAFGELKPSRSVTITAGLFKIPFSLLELLPIADFELADVGPTDDLIKDLGIGGRDIGATIDVAPLKKKQWLHMQAGFFNGDNSGPQRRAVPGLFAARLISRPLSRLRLGADCLYRPYSVSDSTDGVWTEQYAPGGACSADATFNYHRFAIRGEWAYGKRTDVRHLFDQKTHMFMAVWGIATYRMKLAKQMHLLPALRLEWLDEDRESNVGETTYVSAGVNLEFSPNAKLLFDYSRSNVQLGTIWRTSGTPTLKSSASTGVIQLQLML